MKTVASVDRGLSGRIAELFVSFQGEGLLVGRRQLFVRLAGCSVGCGFCDTPEALGRPDRFFVRHADGARETFANPIGPDEVIACAEALGRAEGPIHSVAVTGGEPLEQAAFLGRLLPSLRERIGRPVMLETAGLQATALSRLIEHVDYVSMDLKLPSVAGTPPAFDRHARFLAEALEVEVWVKIVVDDGVAEEDLRAAGRTLSEVEADVPVFLQPRTAPDGRLAATPETLFRAHATLAGFGLTDVRVLPQVHRMLAVP